MEVKIACEKTAKPKLTDEQVRHWILRFRMLDMTKKEHRQKLIDTFVNAIYLYDDKVVITFNYKEGSKIVDFTDLKTAVAGSDLECSGAPKRCGRPKGRLCLFAMMGLERGQSRAATRRAPQGRSSPTTGSIKHESQDHAVTGFRALFY